MKRSRGGSSKNGASGAAAAKTRSQSSQQSTTPYTGPARTELPSGSQVAKWKAPHTWLNKCDDNTEDTFQQLQPPQKFAIREQERVAKEARSAQKQQRREKSAQVWRFMCQIPNSARYLILRFHRRAQMVLLFLRKRLRLPRLQSPRRRRK